MTKPTSRRCVTFTTITVSVFFAFLFACALAPNVMAITVFRGGPINLAMVLGAALMIGSVAITAQFVIGDRRAEHP